MDIIDSDDSDLEMAFMEAVVIPSFRRTRKRPVPRQVNSSDTLIGKSVWIHKILYTFVQNEISRQFGPKLLIWLTNKKRRQIFTLSHGNLYTTIRYH
jgi:hypothetical protein